MATELPEITLSDQPDRMIVIDHSVSEALAEQIAVYAVSIAQRQAPKITGNGAQSLQPISSEGIFGIYFPDPVMWYQDHGTRPFTMRSLSGKTIPMWVDDSSGEMRAKNPNIKTRTTADGRTQVLIFRKAGVKGQQVMRRVKDKKTGQILVKPSNAAYPGAPGRIGRRVGTNSTGANPGAIAAGNSGVKWRHPGLTPRLFLNSSIFSAAQHHGVIPLRVYVADARSNFAPYMRH